MPEAASTFPQSATRSAEILLVEDNPADVRLTQEAFEEIGIAHRVHVARDGDEALAMIRRRGRHAGLPEPDLVLLDLNLPRKDGRQVLADIRGDPDLKHIPVVVLSTSHAECDVLACYELQADCYLHKPVEYEAFAAMIRGVGRFWLGGTGAHTLPRSHPVPPDDISAPRAAAADLKVLLVEDSPADARLLREALDETSARIELHVVGRLADAEDAVRGGAYDCVLLDLGLPDANGVDNVQRIRAAHRGQAVVIMTGLDCEDAALGTLQRGAQDYLVKGRYDGAYIARIIRRAMERNRVFNEVDRMREHQYYAATHDALTGLPNRQLFADRAATAMARVQREGGTLAIGYMDLDGFKPVNDTYGHAVGDALLRTVARVLRQFVRASDTVARAGGDEFLLLLAPVKDAGDAESAVRRLRDKIAAIGDVEGHEVRVSASIGLALYPMQGHSFEALLSRADEAMYAAKRRAQAGRIDAAGDAGRLPERQAG